MKQGWVVLYSICLGMFIFWLETMFLLRPIHATPFFEPDFYGDETKKMSFFGGFEKTLFFEFTYFQFKKLQDNKAQMMGK